MNLQHFKVSYQSNKCAFNRRQTVFTSCNNRGQHVAHPSTSNSESLMCWWLAPSTTLPPHCGSSLTLNLDTLSDF